MANNVLLLHMNEAGVTGGKSLADTSSQANSAKFSSNSATAIKSVTGIQGGGLTFNGSQDQIAATAKGLSAGNTARTVAAWIKPSGSGGVIVSINTASGQKFIVESALATGKWYLYTDGVNAANNVVLTGAQIAPLNKWSHIVFTYDGAKKWAYYLNGALTKNGTFAVAVNTGAPSSVWIGNRADIIGQQFNGQMDEVAIWTRALSATDVSAIYRRQKP